MYLFLPFADTRGRGLHWKLPHKTSRTSADVGEQQLCWWPKGRLFYARLYFAVTENCALQLHWLQRIGSIMCAGVWGIPKQWGKQPSSPACGVHWWVLTERSKAVYHTAAQQWINFLPKLKVAAGPLCLTAMKGLKHSKFIYFLYLFPFESLTPRAPQYLLAIEFSLMT